MAESVAADGKAEKAANGAGGGGDAAGDGKKRVDQAVAFHELFWFADKWDLMLMAAGSLGALAHGAAMPLFFLLFGDLINGFGKNQTDLRTMTDEVAKVRTFFLPSLTQTALPAITSRLSRIEAFFRRDRRFLSQLSSVYGANRPIRPLLQYALYFVYLGLVVCVSSYAGDHLYPSAVPPPPRVPYDSPSLAVFSDAPRLFSSIVVEYRGLFAK